MTSVRAQPRRGKREKTVHSTAATSKTPPLLFILDGEKRKVPPAMLANSQFAGDLQADCDGAKSPARIRLSRLLEYPDDTRMLILNFLARLRSFRAVVDGESFENPLEAVLSLPVDPEDVNYLRRWKLAALEVSVLCFPDSLEVVCNRVLERMRGFGLKGMRISDVIKEARQIMTQLRRGAVERLPATKVLDVFAEAPVVSEMIVPAEWRLSMTGIESQTGQSPGVPAPIVIVGRGKDIHRDTELTTIAFLREGKWHTKAVDRRKIADHNTIVELAATGLPVTSLNARTLVQYLNDFEAANIEHLPCALVSPKMGWQGKDGRDGFLWGRVLLNAKRLRSTEKAPSSLVRFRGADDGDDQLADGFRAAGDFDVWLNAVKPLSRHPRALLGLYASFVPPMLSVLRTHNFVVDYSGQTTTGKTTALRVFASVWGNPDERSAASVLSTWNTTATWRERVPGVCCDLPMLMDDTKNVRFPDDVAKTIYAVVQGRGKGRGTPQGIATQDHYVTVLFSSGEQPATSFTKDGGTRPRVLSIWGSPFSETSPQAADLVRRLNALVRRHYGRAGPRFVQYLLQHREDWKAWRKQFEDRVREFESYAGKDIIASRMASHFAAITVTSLRVHKALELPWKWRDPIKPLWNELTASSQEADVAANALRFIVDWAAAHSEAFYSDNTGKTDQPHGGWAGRWDLARHSARSRNGQAKWPWIGFLQHSLERLLRENEFDHGSTVRSWKERGWLVTDDNNRNTKRVQIGSILARVVAIRREAVESIDADGKRGH